MTQQLSSELVWDAMEKELFAVLGMVSAKGEARTAGVVYAVHNRKLYIASNKDAWKVRHVSANPHVSVTVTIAKRIPLLPWIKIPAATITFAGSARVLEPEQADPAIVASVLRGLTEDPERLALMCLIEVEPVGDFITYGVGIPLMQMRDTEKAGGRAPVA